MNNNQNNNVVPSGTPVQNNGTYINNPVNNVIPTVSANNNVTLGAVPNQQPTNNNVVLGNVSNVTYQDTIGTITPDQVDTSNNQYINPNVTTTNTAINDLNVDGGYNNMNADTTGPDFNNPPEYINDEQVRANIEGKQKNTVTITKELKLVIVLALVLLFFILFMPNIADAFNKLIYL